MTEQEIKRINLLEQEVELLKKQIKLINDKLKSKQQNSQLLIDTSCKDILVERELI